MNILIVGEYSSFSKNLAIGLRELGHEVIVFASLDGWKKICPVEGSILYPTARNIKIGRFVIRRSWIFRGMLNYLHFKRDICKFKRYFDAALIVNYEFIRLRFDFTRSLFTCKELCKVMKDGSNIFLSACGDDMIYLKHLPYLRYHPPIDPANAYFKSRLRKIFYHTINTVTGIIPVLYDYSESYRYFAKQYRLNVLPTIPLPIKILPNSFKNDFGGKIVIFHGLSRRCKGGEFIVPALERIQKDFPDKVEVIMKGGMPLDEYLCLMKKTNIVIDQCWGYCYGMNAIYAMSMGKIVLSGNEPENEQEFGCKVPIVNIKPNVDDIYMKVKWLISLSTEDLISKAQESYDFCCRFHDAKVVAKQYVDVFLRS